HRMDAARRQAGARLRAFARREELVVGQQPAALRLAHRLALRTRDVAARAALGVLPQVALDADVDLPLRGAHPRRVVRARLAAVAGDIGLAVAIGLTPPLLDAGEVEGVGVVRVAAVAAVADPGDAVEDAAGDPRHRDGGLLGIILGAGLVED